uniref:Transposon TX1 uncharacterized n=1 Tax=Cajanus cajan TaxID=3821 RepID=A0A151R808_CAJCA|nr:Transposon TX1 uncharacterized [Cajanus cajan]
MFHPNRAALFGHMMEECHLLTLDQVGGHFMWHRMTGQHCPMHKQLDRVVGDVAWRIQFPEAVVEVLPRRHSDHNPLLLRCGGFHRSRGVCPFRFEAAWCTHDDYAEVVRSAWNRGNGDVAKVLNHVQDESLVFNKEVFGNITTRKLVLDRRLRGIKRSLERVDSLQLQHLYHKLLQECELMLFQEETLWFQKSRESWVKLGNKNTRFFHTQTVVKRNKSHIHGLYLTLGNWCTDEDQLQTATVEFFRDLIGQSSRVTTSPITPRLSPIPTEATTMLGSAPSKEEVFVALKSMPSYKAPGPDGFQAIFYKMYWHIIGDDVWKVVRDAFITRTFDPNLAKILTLIPKVADPKWLKDF